MTKQFYSKFTEIIDYLRLNIFVFLASTLSLPTVAQEPLMLRIDPLQSRGGNSSQIFKEISYIPLETTKESIFGRIDQLFIANDYFIILDTDTNSILFFYKNGKFHCKIEGGEISKRYSPRGIRFFSVNTEQKEISYKISQTKILVYNFDGKKLREDDQIKANYYYYLPNGKIVFSYFRINDKSEADSLSNELVWQLKGKTYKTALPYATKSSIFTGSDNINIFGSSLYRSSNDNKIAYFKPYDYNIYQLNSDSIWSSYSFVLPAAISLPQDFLSNSSYFGKRFGFIKQQQPRSVWGISHFYELNDLIFFKFETGSNNDINSFMYNTKSSNLISISNITSDDKNFWLPLFGRGSAFSLTNFLAVDESSIYTSASSLDIFNSKEQTLSKKIKYNLVMENYFNTESKTSNPVIIRLEPKKGL
jgi:hypothetical protein